MTTTEAIQLLERYRAGEISREDTLQAFQAALAGQYLLSRYWQEFLDMLTAAPKKSERLRGRAV